jgi:hypothetical protein
VLKKAFSNLGIMVQAFSHVRIIENHAIDIFSVRQRFLILTLPYQVFRWNMRKTISHKILGARFVMEDRTIIFEKKSPTKNLLCTKLRQFVREILMVRVDLNLTTIDSILKGFEGFNDGKKFFLNCRIVPLGAIEFSGIESYVPRNEFLGLFTPLFLIDTTAELVVTGIGLDLEGKAVIGIC